MSRDFFTSMMTTVETKDRENVFDIHFYDIESHIATCYILLNIVNIDFRSSH